MASDLTTAAQMAREALRKAAALLVQAQEPDDLIAAKMDECAEECATAWVNLGRALRAALDAGEWRGMESARERVEALLPMAQAYLCIIPDRYGGNVAKIEAAAAWLNTPPGEK